MAAIRKVKAKVKKVVSKKIALKRKPKITKAKAAPPKLTKKEIPGAQEIAVGRAKFSHPEASRVHRGLPQELPGAYGRDRMVLMVRDPWWLFTFWEVRPETVDRIKNELKDDFYKAQRVLRVYDVTNINFNGNNANKFFDININEFASSWYIESAAPGRSWCVDLGLRLPNRRFITILRSNIVHSPLDSASSVTDEEWMIPDELFARLYGMGFGLGKSSPVGKSWIARSISSPGMASMSSPSLGKPKQRGFWLKVDCELIVYGATEPDAKVTVQGRPITLRPDGTFTMRYYLPDGKQVIPVKAVSGDNEESRVITPIVTRETK